MSPDDPRHGTTAGHQAHRKTGEVACKPCIAAKTRYEKVRHVYGDRMVPALGTRRRVQALKALGHSGADIAARLGVTYQAVHKIEHGQSERVFAATARAVARVFSEMSMSQPTGMQAKRTRNQAIRRGYAPPLAWDDIDTDEGPNMGGRDDAPDPIVVERLIAGHHVPSTHADKVEAMRQWLASGRSQRSLCVKHRWRENRYITRDEGAA